MIAIACVLIAFAHTCFANSIPLKEPVSLSALIRDLESLEAQFPSAESWPESRIIKYSDNLQIEVTRDLSNHLVVENVAIAKLDPSQKGVQDTSSHIRKLFFSDGWTYFNEPGSTPVHDVEKYYIVEYELPVEQLDKEPAIEYISEQQFKRELHDLIPELHLDGKSSSERTTPTVITTTNGHKLNVFYDKQDDTFVLKGRFHILVHSDHWNIIEKRSFHSLHCHVHKESVCVEFLKLGLGRVFGVKMTK